MTREARIKLRSILLFASAFAAVESLLVYGTVANWGSIFSATDAQGEPSYAGLLLVAAILFPLLMMLVFYFAMRQVPQPDPQPRQRKKKKRKRR